MKILFAHNLYRSSSPSGENQAVNADIGLLRAHGVDVESYFGNSDELLGRSNLSIAVQHGLSPVYSATSAREIRAILDEFEPDVLHIHNVFPLLSPAIIREAKKRGTPVVQTVHNYRHSCLNGLHFRDGRSCTDCVDRKSWLPGVVHACYRGSRAQSGSMALSQMVHRSTWGLVDRFIALSPFMASRLAMVGVEPSRIVLRPSWTTDPGSPTESPRSGALYVGRLDEAKGVRLLLDAWASRDPRQTGVSELRIVGDGPMHGAVTEAASRDESIEFVGPLPHESAMSAVAQAALVLVPSLTFEGFPLVLVEAFARGTPAMVTRGGSAETLVDDSIGWRTVATPAAIAKALGSVTTDELNAKGRSARVAFEQKFTPEAAFRQLTSIYESVVS